MYILLLILDSYLQQFSCIPYRVRPKGNWVEKKEAKVKKKKSQTTAITTAPATQANAYDETTTQDYVHPATQPNVLVEPATQPNVHDELVTQPNVPNVPDEPTTQDFSEAIIRFCGIYPESLTTLLND